MKKKEMISIIHEMNSEIKLEHYVPKKLAKKLLFNELIHKYRLDKLKKNNHLKETNKCIEIAKNIMNSQGVFAPSIIPNSELTADVPTKPNKDLKFLNDMLESYDKKHYGKDIQAD